MKILVIGSQGFIGQHCMRFFLREQHDVWGVDVNPSSRPKFFQVSATQTDFDFIFRQQKFDVCINASGSANVAFSFENPEVDFELNVLNVHKLLVAIRKYNPTCRFINFSSAAVYGNPCKLPISEDFAAKPLSPYGFHKLQSEYLLAEYHKFFGLYTCSLRVFSAYGEGLKKQLFWDLHQKALRHDVVELFGTGEETRDFIHIKDLLRAVNVLIEKADFEGEVFNVASGQETKIADAVNTFFKIYDPGKKYLFSGKKKIGDPDNWRADISKIRYLGFEPAISLEEGLNLYVKWLKESK
ncbi:MAG: NAD-dependent epimerase [Patescibacteria group bacterium]|nr:MAG: NAD-dependent epimerase [Patescibacteria group bacterium]